MEQDYTIPLIIIATALWCLIIYTIIYHAVKRATKAQNYNLTIMNRLLLTYLKKHGMSQKDLADIHNMTTDEFWKYLEEIKGYSPISSR